MFNISLPSQWKYSMDHIFHMTKKSDWKADGGSLIYFIWGSPGICYDLCLHTAVWLVHSGLKRQTIKGIIISTKRYPSKHNSDILCLGTDVLAETCAS